MLGLTTWKGDVVRKGDVTVAKNYLHEPEITELNRWAAGGSIAVRRPNNSKNL